MESDFNIEVIAHGSKRRLFDPFVTFCFRQIQPTANFMTDSEIDFQVDLLIQDAKN